MKRQAVEFRHSYFVNPVTLSLLALLIATGATLWSVGPALLVRVETNRVLISTLEKFERRRATYLESEQQLDSLYSAMLQQIYQAGVHDDELEAWIEVDENDQVEVGVIYSVQASWPLDFASPSSMLVDQRIRSSD